MKYLQHFICGLLFIFAFACHADSHYDKGVKFEKGGNEAAAIEEYWQAAADGNEAAFKKLSKIYNRWVTKGHFDWSIPRKYLQQTADTIMGEKTEAIPYSGNFFIIAPEDAILENLGIETISKKYYWGGDKRCWKAIERLFHAYYVRGKHGKVMLRRFHCGKKIGDVALLDTTTAQKQFHLTAPPLEGWSIYVKSPEDETTLIPFADFHRYVYESKIAAFYDLCAKLGAKRIEVHYIEEENGKILVESAVDAKATGNYALAAQVAVAIENNDKQQVKSVMTFKGSGIVGYSTTPWLKAEPTWEKLQYVRRSRTNNLLEYQADFHYYDDYNVNVNTQEAFADQHMKISNSNHVQCQGFKKIAWRFHVTFPQKIIVLPKIIWE